MDLDEKWEKTLEETKVIKFYRHLLSNTEATTLPYIFLGESLVNNGDTVVRKGKVLVDHPFLILPQNIPQFSGFEFEKNMETNESALPFFFMVRGISFPSLKYKHEFSTIEVLEKHPQDAIEYYKNEIEREEDLETGLVFGPADCWQLSVLIYVGLLAQNSAPDSLEKYLEELRRKFLSEGQEGQQ